MFGNVNLPQARLQIKATRHYWQHPYWVRAIGHFKVQSLLQPTPTCNMYRLQFSPSQQHLARWQSCMRHTLISSIVTTKIPCWSLKPWCRCTGQQLWFASESEAASRHRICGMGEWSGGDFRIWWLENILQIRRFIGSTLGINKVYRGYRQ